MGPEKTTDSTKQSSPITTHTRHTDNQRRQLPQSGADNWTQCADLKWLINNWNYWRGWHESHTIYKLLQWIYYFPLSHVVLCVLFRSVLVCRVLPVAMLPVATTCTLPVPGLFGGTFVSMRSVFGCGIQQRSVCFATVNVPHFRENICMLQVEQFKSSHPGLRISSIPP